MSQITVFAPKPKRAKKTKPGPDDAALRRAVRPQVRAVNPLLDDRYFLVDFAGAAAFAAGAAALATGLLVVFFFSSAFFFLAVSARRPLLSLLVKVSGIPKWK